MKDIPISDYPSDVIPANGKEFVGLDYGVGDSSCEVKGFYKDGILHIQEINYIAPKEPQ